MKDFIIGFLSCLCLMVFMGSTSQQVANYFNDPSSLYNQLTQMQRDINENRFMVLKTTPLASSLAEGQGVIVSTGTRSVFFRVDSSTYFFTLNKN